MALLPVILFWTCKDEHSKLSARNRNRSWLSRNRLSASIWISARTIGELGRRNRFSLIKVSADLLKRARLVRFPRSQSITRSLTQWRSPLRFFDRPYLHGPVIGAEGS